jgi:4a-hydroxytetrahydrobiopterin dehydratase
MELPTASTLIRVASETTRMAELLSDEEIEERAPDGWERDGDEIVRVYGFDDYLRGVAFASEVGEVAEEKFHHPEIRIRYEEVEVRLTSHEEGGITGQDVEMAERFDELR